ncbi:MAG: hypothetical protein CMK09_10010 [Ponticaulis sp.]|nr:hypothetical protein [Ponticaulis sp.]|tara:strand:- start:19380 stop:19697 length:318 start_codon:yes stop_codon:yes gene_type:complete
MKTLITAIALTSLIAPPAALAQDKFQIDFSYDKAELMSADGTEALYKRLQDEIRDACDLTSSRKGLKMRQLENACVNDTTETALRSISSSRLTAYHQSMTGVAAG